MLECRQIHPEKRGNSGTISGTQSGQPGVPLAEPASISAPGWPHCREQAHSTADVWLVVWPGPLVGFFCSERLLKSKSGFSLCLGHESLLLGLERGWGRGAHAPGAPSHSGPCATEAHGRDRLPVRTFQVRLASQLPASNFNGPRVTSARPRAPQR